jgi:hypothetical protein
VPARRPQADAGPQGETAARAADVGRHATATSRALSYGTIYTTKLLRAGAGIDRNPSADPLEDLTAADAMRPFPAPLPAKPRPAEPPETDPVSLPAGFPASRRTVHIRFTGLAAAAPWRPGGPGLC